MENETEVPASGPVVGQKEFGGKPKITVASFGGSYHRDGGLHIDIHGLDPHELELMKGALHGYQWVCVKEGRLESVPAYEPLPAPEKDEMMLPFWRPPTVGVETQLSLFDFGKVPDFCVPSIVIEHLCGYYYSPENYRLQAAQLQRWGFVCLRSRRDSGGQFYEQWLLPSLWQAKEELKTVIDEMSPFAADPPNSMQEFLREVYSLPSEEKKKKKQRLPQTHKGKLKRQLDSAISFLCRKAQFGTLDVTLQRAAMSVD